MANIKTINEMVWSGSNDSTFQTASGSLWIENNSLYTDAPAEHQALQLIRKKIDELVAEVNTLKNL
tara:strand:- start:4078 stop:4275 length:198 start_codon:yes stop_codon:yes gene_type:complete